MKLKTLLSVLPIIHLFMVLGLVVFAGFVYWQNQDFNAEMNSGDSFIYVVPIVAAIGYFASKSVFQNLINKPVPEDALKGRLARYQTATIIKYALLEVPTILALAAYLSSGNALYLVIALCLIVYFYTQRPTRKRVLSDLQLTREEQKELDLKN